MAASLQTADDCLPGGCVDIGSGAQEELLFRRTALCIQLAMYLRSIRSARSVYFSTLSVTEMTHEDFLYRYILKDACVSQHALWRKTHAL